MKIKGLDNKEHLWSLSDKQRGKVSQHHQRARELLQSLFPLDKVYEEQMLPGSKTGQFGLLCADFYIHSRKLMFEVQGEQHFEYNSFFYKSKLDFLKAKKRDADKKEWCELNGIILIELPYNESNEQWTARINGR